jgi:hypothetical protein
VLEGEHAKAKCEGCHPNVDVGGGVHVRKYRGVPRTCSACHEDAHHGQFRGLEP